MTYRLIVNEEKRDLWKRLKVFALQQDRKIGDVIFELCEEALDRREGRS